MACRICGSGNEQEFTAEINIHFRGLKNIDNPSVLVFPNVLVCLSCGMSRFTVDESKLALLASSAQTGTPAAALENFDRDARAARTGRESLIKGNDETAA